MTLSADRASLETGELRAAFPFKMPGSVTSLAIFSL
jgi:hypothetical protein